MSDELWGLGPMASGGVGGVSCLITRLAGCAVTVPPWTASTSSTAGLPTLQVSLHKHALALQVLLLAEIPDT
jgi:hypothetical protein